jgi:uncharacterized membrane protein YphA (DoxX/SURF4 family)
MVSGSSARPLLQKNSSNMDSRQLVPFLMLIARTIEVVAGFSLAFGIYPQLTAVAILAFLFPATLTAHASWQVAGTASFTVQLLNFFKSTAMMGGLLFIAATQSQPTLLPTHCAVKRSGMDDKTKGLLALPHVRLDIERVSSGLIKTSRDGSQGDSSNVPRVSSTTFAIQANNRRCRGRRP